MDFIGLNPLVSRPLPVQPASQAFPYDYVYQGAQLDQLLQNQPQHNWSQYFIPIAGTQMRLPYKHIMQMMVYDTEDHQKQNEQVRVLVETVEMRNYETIQPDLARIRAGQQQPAVAAQPNGAGDADDNGPQQPEEKEEEKGEVNLGDIAADGAEAAQQPAQGNQFNINDEIKDGDNSIYMFGKVKVVLSDSYVSEGQDNLEDEFLKEPHSTYIIYRYPRMDQKQPDNDVKHMEYVSVFIATRVDGTVRWHKFKMEVFEILNEPSFRQHTQGLYQKLEKEQSRRIQDRRNNILQYTPFNVLDELDVTSSFVDSGPANIADAARQMINLKQDRDMDDFVTHVSATTTGTVTRRNIIEAKRIFGQQLATQQVIVVYGLSVNRIITQIGDKDKLSDLFGRRYWSANKSGGKISCWFVNCIEREQKEEKGQDNANRRQQRFLVFNNDTSPMSVITSTPPIISFVEDVPNKSYESEYYVKQLAKLKADMDVKEKEFEMSIADAIKQLDEARLSLYQMNQLGLSSDAERLDFDNHVQEGIGDDIVRYYDEIAQQKGKLEELNRSTHERIKRVMIDGAKELSDEKRQMLEAQIRESVLKNKVSQRGEPQRLQRLKKEYDDMRSKMSDIESRTRQKLELLKSQQSKMREQFRKQKNQLESNIRNLQSKETTSDITKMLKSFNSSDGSRYDTSGPWDDYGDSKPSNSRVWRPTPLFKRNRHGRKHPYKFNYNNNNYSNYWSSLTKRGDRDANRIERLLNDLSDSYNVHNETLRYSSDIIKRAAKRFRENNATKQNLKGR
jgi:hypothetical protein